MARSKPARFLSVAVRRSALRARPALFLSLSAISLGILAPLLPTSLLTAILLMSGIALAVLGTGANLASTISSLRPNNPIVTDAPPADHSPKTDSAPGYEPRQHLTSARLVPHQQHCPAPPPHDWAELMARIHHELRTPLNAVIGFSEVMALEMFGPLGSGRYQDYVGYIRDSAGDLLKSAEDTLALTSLLTNPRTAEAPVASTLDHAVSDAWTALERKAAANNVHLSATVPVEIEVLSEARALRQILVNMLSEGIDRALPGAHISLLAVADGELIEIVLSVNGGRNASAPRTGSLAICLARTLLEMQGTSLLEIETPAGGWSAVTVLDRAVQPDFFTSTSAPAWQSRQYATAFAS
ncbi:MAG: HAMP domain-containing sensor histidine kinase [Hyphomicrobium sp.]